MNWLFSVHWVAIAAAWYIGNGVLHDISILMKHNGEYDRELLRLLLNGHILIVSGTVLIVCYLMMLSKIPYGATIAIIIAAGMLLYCAMIFPFLKSFVTMAISIELIVVSINSLVTFHR